MFDPKTDRDQTRQTATLPTGDYTFYVETLACRTIGKKEKPQERVFITGHVDGERQIRRFEVPVYFSRLNAPTRDMRHFQLFADIWEALGASPADDAEESPNAYIARDCGPEAGTAFEGLPLGAYDVTDAEPLTVRIAQTPATEWQKAAGQDDKRGFVNTIARLV